MSEENLEKAGVLLFNAIWNISRYVITLMILLIVPPFLIHNLTTETYATWLLLLQIATYYYPLDVNIQTAVSRFTAQSMTQGDVGATLSSILAFLAGLALIVLILGLAGAAALGDIFPAIPRTLLPKAQLSAAMIVGALVLSLPFNTIVGAFLGFQRNRIVTIGIVVSKLTSGIAMILAVKLGGELLSLAICFSLATMLAPAIYLYAWKRFDLSEEILISTVKSAKVWDFAKYSGSLGFVAMSGILTSSLALPILGVYDFRNVPVYSLALVYGNMMVLQQAVLTVALPMLSRRGATDGPDAMAELVLKFARFSSFSLVLFTVGLIMIAPLFLHFWIGAALAERVLPPAMLILLSNFIIQAAQPYRIAILGIGKVIKTVPAILVEGVACVLLSLLLVRWWGVIGLAVAALLASLIGFLAQCLLSMPRTPSVVQKPLDYLLVGLGYPLLAIMPAIIAAIVFWQRPLSLVGSAGVAVVFVSVSLFLIIWFNTTASERLLGYDMLRSRIQRFRHS